ncbi:MAG TPA: sigma-70 family RNA polymerase sigma factor [Clostridia bacterium]|nr:sigma-70 family RNA polymerase sigma factor [Clostridia bacterium]
MKGMRPMTEEQRTQELEYLMRRFGPKVRKIAYYYVRDRYQAEDIAQEVFCRVYRHLDRFRGESGYYTWIYRITVNLCKDYLRSAYFRRMIPWGEFRYLHDLKEREERMFEAVEGGELFQKVMDLPLKYRTVTALYYFEDMSTAEIAAVLGVKENLVRTRLCRARKILKEILARGEAYGRSQTRQPFEKS